MTSNRPVSEMVEGLDSLMIDYPRGEYDRGWNCGIAEAAALVRAASSQAPSDDVVEKAAEAMWQSESERASGRRRLIPWNEEGGDTQAKWRSLARAAIAAIPPDGGAEERLRSLVETGRDYVKDVADGFAWKLCAESAMQQAKDDLALFDAALNTSASPESTSK